MNTEWLVTGPNDNLDPPNMFMQQTNAGPSSSYSHDRNVQPDERSQYSQSSKKRARSYSCTKCSGDGQKTFTTSNDLERHLRGVHGILRDGDRIWKCPIPGCPSTGKVWTRFDNCKAHILRHGPQHESQVAFAASTYNSKVDQLPRPTRPRHVSSSSIGSRSKGLPLLETSSPYMANSSWRDVSPTRCSDHSANNVLVHDSMMNMDPNLFLDFSVVSDSNDLAAVGNFDEHSVAGHSTQGLLPTITLQEAEIATDAGSIALAPTTSSKEWTMAKKMAQKASDSMKRNANLSPTSVMEHPISPKALTLDDYDVLPGESPRTLISFKSAGERSFLGYNVIDIDEQTEVLNTEELHVAHVLGHLVVERYLRLKRTGSLPISGATSHPTGSSEKHSNYNSQSHSSSMKSPSRKRPLQDDDDLDPDGGNGNNGGEGPGRGGGKRGPPNPGPRAKRSKTEHHKTLSFACPYHKADPNRYSPMNTSEREYRNCGTCLLHSISAVRQHLYRVHKRPDHYCSFCFETFTSPVLRDMHHRETNGQCGMRDDPFTEKMPHDVYQSVKIMRLQKSKDEQEKEEYARNAWYDMFKVIFPGRSIPSSPYADADEQLAIWNYVEVFRVLGQQMAELLCENVNHSVTGRSLPPFTQAIFDEAFNVFTDELAQREGELLVQDVPAQWQADLSWQESNMGQGSALAVPSAYTVPKANNNVYETSQTYTDEGVDVHSVDERQTTLWPQQTAQAALRPSLTINPNFQPNQQPLMFQSPYTSAPLGQSPSQPGYPSPWHPLS